MSFKTYRVSLMFTASIALNACAGGPAFQPIELRSVTVIPDVRVGKTVYAYEAKALAVDMGVTHIRGSDSTTATGAVRIGNQTFSGSPTVNTDFNFSVYDVSARFRHFGETDRLGYEFAAGVGYADLSLAASSPTGQGTESVSSPAFRLAGGGMWRFRPTTHLEGNATLFVTKSQFQDLGHLGISLAQRLGPHATIRGGYSTWGVEAPDSARSRVTLRFTGPSIGLGLNF